MLAGDGADGQQMLADPGGQNIEAGANEFADQQALQVMDQQAPQVVEQQAPTDHVEAKCNELHIPPGMLLARRAANEAYWSFGRALVVAESKIDRAVDDALAHAA